MPRTILSRSRPDPRNNLLVLIVETTTGEDFVFFDWRLCWTVGGFFVWDFVVFRGFFSTTGVVGKGGIGFVRRNFTRSSIDNDGGVS